MPKKDSDLYKDAPFAPAVIAFLEYAGKTLDSIPPKLEDEEASIYREIYLEKKRKHSDRTHEDIEMRIMKRGAFVGGASD
jgi:hypothetical protein